MRTAIALALGLAGLAACRREPVPTTSTEQSQSPRAVSPPGSVAARPCGTTKTFFEGTAIADREGWYGKHLVALGESILCQRPDGTPTVFRLTWLPSFHPSVVVRIEQNGGGSRFEAKAETGAGGYEPGRLARDTILSLSAAEQNAFERLLQEADFWQLPTVPPPDGTVGLDGAQWILEGMAEGRYHVVDRWSPDRQGPDAKFRQLAEWLLAESGLVSQELVSEY